MATSIAPIADDAGGQSASVDLPLAVITHSQSSDASADQPEPSTDNQKGVTSASGLKCWILSHFHEIKQWMYDTGITDAHNVICSFIIHKREYDMIPIAKDSGYPCNCDIQLHLARAGDLDGLKWFRESRLISVWLKYRIQKIAVDRADLDVLKWVYEQFSSSDDDRRIYDRAVKKGRIEIVEWFDSRRSCKA